MNRRKLPMSNTVDVCREVYVPYTERLGAPVVGVRYLGKGLRREESLSYEVSSDWREGGMVRTSEDNGRTWSDWQPARTDRPVTNGFSSEETPFAWCYDPIGHKTLRFIFQRFLRGEAVEALHKTWKGEKTYFDHCFWQFSDDDGRSWSQMQQLRYEDGARLTEKDNPSEDFLKTNQMYAGHDAISTRDGTIVFPVAEVPTQVIDGEIDETIGGVRCFIGRWNEAEQTYLWEVSQPVAVSHRISGRGLMEPAIAELTDGRLLLEMRGSTEAVRKEWKGKVESPGRRWISTSEDGGRTWSTVTDLRYDTGEQFYSPSAHSEFLRHSRTGKLYWFGNITPAPPDGNLPRYPLYLAEVDESAPSLKKDTLTIIDDYDRDNDSPEIQFSNFKILEDRETGKIELYMTRYGESKEHWLRDMRRYGESKKHWLRANQYKYTISLLGCNRRCVKEN
jgi:hypothetical protein